jgi:hypothetical protein
MILNLLSRLCLGLGVCARTLGYSAALTPIFFNLRYPSLSYQDRERRIDNLRLPLCLGRRSANGAALAKISVAPFTNYLVEAWVSSNNVFPPNLAGKRVYLFPIRSCLTANPIALFDPTTIANFFARVNPVYTRFRDNNR